jgi:phage baseplate assembly protein W
MAFQPLIIDGDLNNVSDNSGYHLISDIRTNIKQNLKMLVLTSPGERVMDPNFGVGIKRFLFLMSASIESDSKNILISQTLSNYLLNIAFQDCRSTMC